MIVFLLVLLVLVAGLVAAAVLGWGRGASIGMAEATSSASGPQLPDELPVTSEALARVRFDRALRGYRMDQVDAVIDRLRQDIAEREARLDDFAAAAGGSFPVVSFEDDTLGLDPFRRPEDL